MKWLLSTSRILYETTLAVYHYSKEELKVFKKTLIGRIIISLGE
jgi:hypothetical protein